MYLAASVPLSIPSPYSFLAYGLSIAIGFKHKVGAPCNLQNENCCQ
jgi:hypothetical protein